MASNTLAMRIRSSKDSLVHTVAQMANSRSGQLYFPFLDNLIKGKISMGEIDKVKGDDLNYYRLLVSTRLDYAGRILPPARDTPMEMNALTEMLAKKGKEVFVREINALHTVDNPAIRFKVLDPLSPAELYYLIVLSEDEDLYFQLSWCVRKDLPADGQSIRGQSADGSARGLFPQVHQNGGSL